MNLRFDNWQYINKMLLQNFKAGVPPWRRDFSKEEHQIFIKQKNGLMPLNPFYLIFNRFDRTVFADPLLITCETEDCHSLFFDNVMIPLSDIDEKADRKIPVYNLCYHELIYPSKQEIKEIQFNPDQRDNMIMDFKASEIGQLVERNTLTNSFISSVNYMPKFYSPYSSIDLCPVNEQYNYLKQLYIYLTGDYYSKIFAHLMVFMPDDIDLYIELSAEFCASYVMAKYSLNTHLEEEVSTYGTRWERYLKANPLLGAIALSIAKELITMNTEEEIFGTNVFHNIGDGSKPYYFTLKKPDN